MYRFLFLLVCNVFSTIALQAQTPLLDAIKAKDLPEVQKLVKEGADTNALDENGATTLMWAAYQSDLEMVKWLVENAADPFLKKGVIYLNKEKTAYYGNLTGIAAGEGKLEMLRYLIEDLGIDVDDKEYNPETGQEDGWTAAQWADSRAKGEMMAYLEKSADISFLSDTLRRANDDIINVATFHAASAYKATILLLEKHIGLLKETIGKTDTSTYAKFLYFLANSYEKSGKYNKAEQYYLNLTSLWKSFVGPHDYSYAIFLNNLALLYGSMGRYAEAETLYLKALDIEKAQLGEEHPSFATSLNNLAGLYESMGRYNETEPLYKQALEITKTQLGEKHPNYASSLNNLASLYYIMGRYDEAEPLYIKTIENRKTQLGEQHPDYVTSLNDLAMLYTSMGRYRDAEPLLLKAIEVDIEQLGEDHPDYATSLNNLAALYQSMGRYTEAETLYLQAMEISKAELGENHPDYATSLNNLAALYQRMGRYVEAEQLYTQALKIRKVQLGEEHPYYATSLNNLALLYQSIGRYAETETLMLSAMRILKEQLGDKHHEYATSLNNLAGLYHLMSRYIEAEPLYKQAMGIFKIQLGENLPSYALTMNNLAALYERRGLYEVAETLMLKVMNNLKTQLGEEHPEVAKSLNNLAALYQRMGRYAEAEQLNTQALKIRKAQLGEDHPDYAQSLNNLAGLHHLKGRYIEAVPLYKQAFEIIKVQLGENHPEYAKCLNNLAALYENIGRYAEAEPLMLKATEIFKSQLGQDHPDYAQNLNNLAALYQSMDLYTDAEPLYIQAIKIIKTQLGEDHPDYAQNLNNLATLYESMSRYDQAESLYLQGQQVYLHQLRTVFPSLSEKEMEQFLNTFSNSFEYFHSFALKRQRGNPAIISHQYDNTILLKGLLLQSSSQIRERILASGDTTAIRLFGDWQALKRQWLRQSEIPKSEWAKGGIAPETTLAEANTLEKELSRLSEAFAEVTDTVRTTWQDIQQELKQGEAAIEMVRFRFFADSVLKGSGWAGSIYYAALIITPEMEDHPHLVLFNNGNELEERGAQSYQSAFATRGASRVEKGKKPIPPDSLYAYFWQPIQEALDSLGGAGKVYLSADGVYHTVNLQTLKNPETGKYLLETLDIERVGSTRDLVKKRKHRYNNNKVVLAGYPTYPASPEAVGAALQGYQQGQMPVPTASLSSSNYGSYQTYRAIDANMNSISPLSGTLAEVEQLASILNRAGIPTQALLENAASEDVLKKVKSPRILHIATHGFFEPESEQQAEDLNRKMHMSGLGQETVTENPYLRCGLYLAGAETTLKNRGNPDFRRPEGQEDGILTAYEATLLDLRGTELVVLSACETGLGVTKNGEGVYGLQRAFQVAGAETVIFSLWKVADEQTQEMMGLFYQNWLQKDMTKRQAFKSAQQTIKEKYEDPYFWGAFVMIGG
tara:strand:- start:45278 stop:49549 length:4272 start_codon:yes stop_codon:yes gene_type:complete